MSEAHTRARTRVPKGTCALSVVVFAILALADVATYEARAQTLGLDGCWLGTMGDGPSTRRVAFELMRSETGEWSGTAHLFSNSVQTHAMSELRVDGSSFSFGIANVAGEPRFLGSMSGATVRGAFTQHGNERPVRLQRVPGPDADGLAVVGTWSGSLEQNGTPLMRLVLDVVQVACGQIAATMDSPDQGARGMPVTSLAVRGDSLFFGMTYLNGAYVGRLRGTERVEGTWTQNGVAMTLHLERFEGTLPERRRPQEPEKPYPYDAEEVTYVNVVDGVTLAGTLTTPPGDGPFPAVLLLTGSGAQDRDESLAGHRPFLVLADHLTRAGIAVLRVDDRGVGGSTGSTLGSTLEDSAEDALASLAFLKSHAKIDARHLGLVGHSEGGWVAPIVATRSNDVAFLVLLAGPAVSGEALLLAQSVQLNLAAGSSRAFAERAARVAQRLYDILRREPDDSKAGAALVESARAARDELLAASTSSTDTLLTNQWADSFGQQTGVLTTAWFRHLLNFDPRATLERVRVPVLALYGALDLQVPASQSQPELERALAAARNPDVTIHVLDNLNHLFQTARTGRMEEYGTIEETFAPTALSIVSEWIVARTR